MSIRRRTISETLHGLSQSWAADAGAVLSVLVVFVLGLGLSAGGRIAGQTPPSARQSTAGAADVSAMRTVEANAKSLLRASSDYMAAHLAFSFDYDTYLESVTQLDQKLGLARSASRS